MTPLSNALEALNQLGLTRYQAKIYLSLVGKRPSSANEIAHLTSLNRGNIYLTLGELYQLGLVEKVISSPKKYRAVPIDHAASVLIARKKREFTGIQKIAKELINQTEIVSSETESKADKNALILVPGQQLLATIEKAFHNTTSNIDTITSFSKFRTWISLYPDIYLKALKRGVKIRLILDEPKRRYSKSKEMSALICEPNFALHYATTPLKAHLGVFDNKVAICNTSTSDELAGSSGYFTENPCLTSLFKEYFELLWSATTEQTTLNSPFKIC